MIAVASAAMMVAVTDTGTLRADTGEAELAREAGDDAPAAAPESGRDEDDAKHATRAPAELREFFADIDTIRGGFSQVLFDTRGEAVERSAGDFAILKPGRFRWHYTEPYEQLIVADGESIWLYDADFEQVTVREQTNSLSQSPAMLLGGDAAALESFRYLGSYSRDGRDWLRLEPAAPESDFRAVSLSFAGGELELMELVDALGQVTRIEFRELVTNESLDASLFTFEPPAGVDVIGVGDVPAASPAADGG